MGRRKKGPGKTERNEGAGLAKGEVRGEERTPSGKSGVVDAPARAAWAEAQHLGRSETRGVAGLGRGLLRAGGWVLGSLALERSAGVGGESSLSPCPRSPRLPPSPDSRLTPELRHQQRQQQLRLGQGARGGRKVELWGSHGRDLGLRGEEQVKIGRNQDPHPAVRARLAWATPAREDRVTCDPRPQGGPTGDSS